MERALLALWLVALSSGCGQREIRACRFATTANWQQHCDLITEAAVERTTALGCEQPVDSIGVPLYGGPCRGSGMTCQERAEDCAAVIDAAADCAEIERIWRSCLSG